MVSVDYRLAPSHRWPAAAEDCYAALVDVAARAAEFGADAQRLAVMGDSAGGNLSAVVILMARDRSGPPISFQGLIYPATDLTWSSPSVEQNSTAPVLTKADCITYRDHYLGGQDPREPYISPLYAPDHTGLPPALIQVAEHDPIRDDGLRYAAALQAAGVSVRTTTYVGMPHGYMTFPSYVAALPRRSENSVPNSVTRCIRRQLDLAARPNLASRRRATQMRPQGRARFQRSTPSPSSADGLPGSPGAALRPMSGGGGRPGHPTRRRV